jgi:2-dehydro-3-deoxy-D-arabinonate dehydratase
MTDALWQVRAGDRVLLAAGPATSGPTRMLDEHDLDSLLARGADALSAAVAAPGGGAMPADARVVAPIGSQPVWASGVTYERSRAARNAESDTPDVYDRVYTADRPELFFKAAGPTVKGPGEHVGIRADSAWDVPEPEVTLVLDSAGRVAGYCCGNDMSSRSIEGANPLYLPQAKVYRDSCALGPCIVPAESIAFNDLLVRLYIRRDDVQAFDESIHTSAIRRRPDELADWLYRAMDFPAGAFLMTGTGIVPPESFTLRDGDEVGVDITGLGSLINIVHTIGTDPKPAGAEASSR